jgi:hypothetical protein
MNHGDGKVKATTWTQLADEVESDGDCACEALAELERRLLDLRMAHECDKPLERIPSPAFGGTLRHHSGAIPELSRSFEEDRI